MLLPLPLVASGVGYILPSLWEVEADCEGWPLPRAGTEHIFLKHFPDLKTSVGYCNGNEEATSPKYAQVSAGSTGHAESVRIEFDPTKVSYEKLVGEFF